MRRGSRDAEGLPRAGVRWSLLICALVVLWQCSEAPQEQDAADTNGETTTPTAAAQDWIDVAREPFRRDWIGGTLRIGHAGAKPATLNPVVGTYGNWRIYHRLLLNPTLILETTDPDSGRTVLEPAMAASMPDWDEEASTLTWTIREGVTWSGGEERPVTADDFVFTWQMLQAAQPWARAWKGRFEDVTAVEKVDDRRFRVQVKEWNYGLVNAFGRYFPILPKHACPDDPAALAAITQLPTSGPYEIERFDDTLLRVRLRPRYRLQPHPIQRAYFEAMEWHFLANDELRAQRFREGGLDILSANDRVVAALREDPEVAARMRVLTYSLPMQAFVVWSNRHPDRPEDDHPFLGDPRVRRAFTMLLDREQLASEAFARSMRLTSVLWPESDLGTVPSIRPLPHDPDAARKLLEDAGWTRGEDGVRAKDGQRMVLRLSAPDGIAPLRGCITRIAEVLRQAGVEVSVDLQPNATWNTNAVAHRHEVTAFYTSNANPMEEDLHGMLHSSARGAGRPNYAGLRDEKMDALLDRARTTRDLEARTEVRREIHRRFHELVPYTPLGMLSSQVVLGPKVANAKAHPYGIRYTEMIDAGRMGG